MCQNVKINIKSIVMKLVWPCGKHSERLGTSGKSWERLGSLWKRGSAVRLPLLLENADVSDLTLALSFFVAFFAGVAFKAALVPFFFTQFMLAYGNFGQHQFVEAGKPSNFRSTYNCVDCFDNTKSFLDGYHVLHHNNSKLHWSMFPETFMKQVDKMKYDAADGPKVVIWKTSDFELDNDTGLLTRKSTAEAKARQRNVEESEWIIKHSGR